ncbi:MAG TPA: hypothetical protein VE379_01230 [Vicinamibacterales bacterium]|nr:hypothetical protein [Vicinamibacterales bacterium]
MYTFVLAVHSWVRWVVLLAGAGAVVLAVVGAMKRRPWGSAEERWGRVFTMSLDIQILLGLVLYFLLSPITRAALSDFGAVMGSAGLRFWAVEHVFGVLVAVALAHVGRGRSKKVADPVARHRAVAICYGLALLALILSIPWPGTPNGRPLVRF